VSPKVEPLNPATVATPLGHLSNATRVGSRLYLAGLVALDERGELVGAGSVADQTRHVVRSIEQICRQNGGDLTNVARCLVFLRDRSLYREFDAAFAEAFGTHKPARATVIAELVNPEFLVEIVSDVELG
jgi:2-iminobutanoate/2-iminopropanoate deaminase